MWKWIWNTETDYYDKEITRNTDWGGDASTGGVPVSGGRVQEWLKNEINGKFGVIRVSSSINEQNFYSLEMFATKEDEALYDEDKETYGDRVTIVTIPISAVQGDSYAAMLTSTISADAEIISTKDTLEIPLNFRGVRITPLEQVNIGASGTLTVQRRISGGEWTDALTLNEVLISRDYNDKETYQYVDIEKALVNATQEVRVRASFEYVDESGATRVMTSSWVLIGKSITKTELRLDLSTDYSRPIPLVDVNGNPANFDIDYIAYGTVSKTLHVEVTGSKGTFKGESTITTSGNVIKGVSLIHSETSDIYGLRTHGVKTVKAWMEADNGLGETIYSNTLVNQFMVASDSTDERPYLLLQNVIEEATNYMQSHILDYAVYSPLSDLITVSFRITNYGDNEEYFRIEREVIPLSKNELTATLEIDTETNENMYAYLRVDRKIDEWYETFTDKVYRILVDNENAFTPVTGATFFLNPKIRSNNESNPARILNSRNNNAEVESTFEGFGFIADGWMEVGGQRVLRVPAGGKLTIKRNLFAKFAQNPDSQLNFEIDFAVHNITNVTDPIIDIAENVEDATIGFKGLRMNALDGWIKTKSKYVADDCLFSWQEGVRTHIFVNIENRVQPYDKDVTYNGVAADLKETHTAIARIFINGDIKREVPFNINDNSEWGDTDIVIGNIGCDIDIYSFRAYENDNRNITPKNILFKNYLSTLPTLAEKQNVFDRNDILDDNGRISIDKVRAKGYNCMVWHGTLPSKINSDEYKGWYEYYRYDENKNLLKEYSGTNCKGSKSLKGKGQGSTAKTYYDWNVQDDNSKIKDTIQVSKNDFHESISVRIDGDTAYIKGGNLGKNFPLETEEEVAYPYNSASGSITVPDGWIDLNGKYRGMGYQVAPNTALAQKKVIKINYASCMQSHLLGACKTYDLLHRAVCGDTPLQKEIPTAVSAKHTEPFFFFHEVDGNVYYKGLGTYGAAKMDKVAWGYVKKKHPMFALIEGSDNNFTLTDFRVPFDKNTVIYNYEEEYWEYNGDGNFDFDGGAMVDVSTPEALEEYGWKVVGSVVEDGETILEAPSPIIRDRWADVCNFIYLHGTNIEYYEGSYAKFIAEYNEASDKTKYTGNKYWFTESYGNFKSYCLYRFNALDEANPWVNAGLLDRYGNYKEVDITTDSVLKSAYEANKGDLKALNTALKVALTANMHKFIKYFINEQSLLFNYSYVLSFLAGTDNSSKNTYYKIMPIAEDFSSDLDTADGEYFETWFYSNFGKDFDFKAVYQIYLDGDDMDSIFKTNNNSHQTKPYYIERMYPYADDKPNELLYEGMKNQLFNYVEWLSKSDATVLPNMMKTILTKASALVSNNDVIYGSIGNKQSAWGFLHKYFFNTQQYFPQIAYNEQARIRYEFPYLIGYISEGKGGRNIDPITQSLGSQLENELQYMRQRLVYYATFAGWSQLTGNAGDVGLNPSSQSTYPAMGFVGSGTTYKFVLKSHQYIYPAYYKGQTVGLTGYRLKPNTEYTLTINTGGENLGDAGVGLYAIDYYTSIGNVGDIVVSKGTFTVQGKRLREFIAEPTDLPLFAPENIAVSATQLERLSLNGCTNIGGAVNLSAITRCNVVDLRETSISSVVLPESTQLESLLLGSEINAFQVKNTPNLNELSFDSYSKISSFVVGGKIDNLNTQIHVERLSDANSGKLTKLNIEKVNWVDFPIKSFMWITDNISDSSIKGSVSIKESGSTNAITFDYKDRINKKWGNVDDSTSDYHKGLLLTYARTPLTSANIKGNFYNNGGKQQQFGVKPVGMYTNTFTKIVYSISKPTYSKCTIDPVSGVLTVEILSKNEDIITVYATISNFVNGVYSEVIASKKIKVYDREAEVGDLVYFDGTYSSQEDYDSEKTVIGICFYSAPRDSEGNIDSNLFNPNDKQTRFMAALELVTNPLTNSTNFTSWGCYNNPYVSNAAELLINGNRLYNNELPSDKFYDIESINNIYSLGTTKATTSNNQKGITRDKLEDENGELITFPVTTALGDGFAFQEKSVDGRTLDDELASLAGNSYKSGDIVNSGYAKTLKIIQHRNKILNQPLYAENTDGEIYDSMPIPTANIENGKSELTSLCELLKDVVSWSVNNGYASEGNRKWEQIYYSSASAAYAYKPLFLKTGETLADKFTEHNWFLAPYGLLARITYYSYFGNIFSNLPVGVRFPSEGGIGFSSTEGEPYSVHQNNRNVYKDCISVEYTPKYVAGFSYPVHPICAF